MLVHPKKTKGHQRRLYQHDKPENGLIETNRVGHSFRDKIEMKEFVFCSLTVSSQNILIGLRVIQTLVRRGSTPYAHYTPNEEG